jgi:hypothetical protein
MTPRAVQSSSSNFITEQSTLNAHMPQSSSVTADVYPVASNVFSPSLVVELNPVHYYLLIAWNENKMNE